MISLRPLAWAGALVWGCLLHAQEPIHEVRWSEEQFVFPQLSAPTLIEVPVVESSGFFFPYYLYIPKGISHREAVRLLVEPNNTGQTTDDFEVHRASSKRLATAGSVRRLADRLQIPLLVPVFPRPRSQWRIYTHYLDRDTMRIKDGPLARIDLQLLSMIRHARQILGDAGIETRPRVFMHGFSASAGFVNRFATLHPESVRAVAAGAINALPMYPLESYEGVRLSFPLGIDRCAIRPTGMYLRQCRRPTLTYASVICGRLPFDRSLCILTHKFLGRGEKRDKT